MKSTIIGQATNRAILIRVNNAGELARSQGSLASFAQTLAPATIEGKVYSEIAKKLQSSFRDQHVDADVSVVEPTGWQTSDGKHIWQDVALGIGAIGAVAIVWRLFAGRSK